MIRPSDEEILRYMPLVERVVRRIRRRLPAHMDIDDLRSAGSLGLWRAIERYDPGRGLKFSTYATWTIRGAVYDELRRVDHAPRDMRRLHEVPVQRQFDLVLSEELRDRGEDVQAAAERGDEVRSLLELCNERERRILISYYLDDMTMSSIARGLGVCQSRVSQLHISCIARLAAGRRP